MYVTSYFYVKCIPTNFITFKSSEVLAIWSITITDSCWPPVSIRRYLFRKPHWSRHGRWVLFGFRDAVLRSLLFLFHSAASLSQKGSHKDKRDLITYDDDDIFWDGCLTTRVSEISLTKKQVSYLPVNVKLETQLTACNSMSFFFALVFKKLLHCSSTPTNGIGLPIRRNTLNNCSIFRLNVLF